MSEPIEHDEIAHRLVIALDALPVPEEPTGLRATATPSLVRVPNMLLAAALLLVLITAVTSPQFQRAAAELTRYMERILVAPEWVGYYHDHTAGDSAVPVRLQVASGDAHGRQTTPDMVGPLVYHGPWSPDRQHIIVSNRSQLYLGDQSGRLRPIADVGDGYTARPLGWIGRDTVLAIVSATPGGAATHEAYKPSYVTVDVRTGALERHIDENFPAHAFWMAPGGRWTAVGVGPSDAIECGFIEKLYDLVTRQFVDIVDASGRSARAFGFLRDGRIVIGQCDREAGTLELYVGTPGARPSPIAVVPIAVRRPVLALGSVNDEIFVIASGPAAPQNAYVFDPSGRLLRRMLLPRLASAGAMAAGLSGDGRFMSFDVDAPVRPGEEWAYRAGVVDLRTGAVTYLCDSGCDYLYLR